MNFLEAPLVTGIIFFFTYMIFELFVRRNERITLIEKMGQNIIPLDDSALKIQFRSLLPSFKRSFTALRMGCLFIGIGLGLLVGLFIYMQVRVNIDHIHEEPDFYYSISFGAPVLVFGGLGLIISYLIEKNDIKKDEEKNSKLA